MMKERILSFLKKFLLKIKEISGLHEETDVEATILSIKKAIEFRGANVWVLAFATIVASVGLNVNSTAVIIGAMLISPLMGPINGMGLAIGMFDNELLRKSIKNLLIMVAISLLASTTYFFVTPLSDAQSELLARTTPTIFDVFIAFFGGMAGIVATSRKEQSLSVISGVAIATALMPPLCTAGFGLATGQLHYFFGAFYLFFINSFFIALATFLMVRYLRFPQKKYLDENKNRFVKRSLTLFTILVMVPSVFLAIEVVKETSFNSQTIKYINAIQESPIFDEVELVKYSKEYSRKERKIFISLIGKQLSEAQIESLRQQMTDFRLEDVKLVVKQTGGTIDVEMQSDILEKLLAKKDKQIEQKDSLLFDLRQKQQQLHLQGDVYRQIAKEIAIQYPEVESFSIAEMIPVDSGKKKEPRLFVNWKTESDTLQYHQLLEWLKVRLSVQELR